MKGDGELTDREVMEEMLGSTHVRELALTNRGKEVGRQVLKSQKPKPSEEQKTAFNPFTRRKAE